MAEDGTLLSEEARKVLAWEDIDAESETLGIDEAQRRQLDENLRRAKRDLREAVWRAYKNVFLLDETNALRRIDLGLVHSSAAESLVGLEPACEVRPGRALVTPAAVRTSAPARAPDGALRGRPRRRRPGGRVGCW